MGGPKQMSATRQNSADAGRLRMIDFTQGRVTVVPAFASVLPVGR